MNFRYLAVIIALLASACTATPQGNNLDADFHPPLTYHHWQVEHYALKDGTKACSISSGYNGLTVAVIHHTDGEGLYVKSNRRMEPGATFTVNTDRGNFQTYDTLFSFKIGRALVEDMTKGGRAYLEWSELSGPSSRERVLVQNIVKLDDFAAQLKQCRDSLHL